MLFYKVENYFIFAKFVKQVYFFYDKPVTDTSLVKFFKNRTKTNKKK